MRPTPVVNLSKICRACGILKPLTDYHKDRRLKHCTKHVCKSCNISRASEHWLTHPERRAEVQAKHHVLHGHKYRPKQRMYKYGVTHVAFTKMLEEQGDCCAICKRPFEHQRRNLDHNHTTGQTRAILCTRCNTCLGVLEDAKFLEQGLVYLSRYS